MYEPESVTDTSYLAERVTENFASRLARGLVPEFRGTFGWTGDGLSVEDESGRTLGLVRRPRDWGLPPSAGLAEDGMTAAGPAAALAVLVAALGLPGLGSEKRNQVPLVASVDPFLAGPGNWTSGSRRPRDEWLGFVPVAHGWVGLAFVGADQRRLVRSLYDAGALQHRSPAAAAQCLQSMGVAALPARSVSTARQRRRDGAGPTRPHELDRTTHVIQRLGSGRSNVLSGLKVLELGRLIAAPLAGRLLESLGADIRRVRPPGHGESWGGGEELDVHHPMDARRIAALIAESDVLIENFRPRGWAQLPALVRDHAGTGRVSVRGFPGSSLCRNWKVFGFLIEGWLAVGRTPLANETGPRRIRPLPLWDRVAGICAATNAVAGAAAQRSAPEISLVELGLQLSAARKEVLRAHAV